MRRGRMRATGPPVGGEIGVSTLAASGRRPDDPTEPAQVANICVVAARAVFAGVTVETVTTDVWSWPQRPGACVSRGAADVA